MVSRLVLFHITSQSFQNELATKTWRKSHRFFFGGESQSKREAKIGFKSGPKRIWGCQGQPKIHAVGFLDFCWGLLRVMVGEPVGRIPTFTTEPPQRKLDRASPFLIGSGKFSWFFPGNSSWSGPHFPLKHDPPTVFLKETHDLFLKEVSSEPSRKETTVDVSMEEAHVTYGWWDGLSLLFFFAGLNDVQFVDIWFKFRMVRYITRFGDMKIWSNCSVPRA